MASRAAEKTKSLVVARVASLPVQTTPARSPKGHFLVGENWTGNRRGRPVGSRNRIAESFLSALYQDFAEHGAEAIAEMRVTDPSGYVRAVASILPRDTRLETKDEFAELSDEELRALVADTLEELAQDCDATDLE